MTLFERASQQWQGIPLSAERFAALWLRLSDSREAPLEDHAADVYLVAACLERSPEALTTLKQLLHGQLPALISLGVSSTDAEEIIAATLSYLLEGRLHRYSGRGPLEAWLRVVLTNRVLDRLRIERREVELDDVLLGNLSTHHEPELELMRERFKGSFSAGFKAAIARLQPRQRNLLRQHHLDELTLEELSALYQVHRATIARWLSDARISLLDLTRDEVSTRLGIGRHEVESVMRVIGSRLDLSAGLFLSAGVTT